jgi:predicted TIM-barrel fold metal-dependent hydrolase
MVPDLSKTAVDTHFHVFAAHQAQPGARYTPAYAAPLSAWQAAAVPQGVMRGVLVQTSFMGTDNRLLLDTLAQHPDTLRGIAVVAPTADGQMLAPLHAAGVRGIRLNLSGLSHDILAWSAATALWDALLALGWHLELHTDIGQSARRAGTTARRAAPGDRPPGQARGGGSGRRQRARADRASTANARACEAQRRLPAGRAGRGRTGALLAR